MNEHEKEIWYNKLYYCWEEYATIHSILSSSTYFQGLADENFILFLQQQYGILIKTNVSKNNHTVMMFDLGVDKVTIIDPNKKLLLDLKYPT